MRAVVVGGSGFLGSHVADALQDAGHDVVVFDRAQSRWLRPGQTMVVGDLLDPEAVARALAGADAVYHYAGIADIDEAAERPVDTMRVNVVGTATLLDACVKARVKRFVLASTVYVYSQHGSFYRVSKQACEALVEAYRERHGLRFTVLRYGSLYGPRSDEKNGIHRYLTQAIRDGKIQYSGSGEEIREYIHVFDAAKLSVDALEERFADEHLILTGQQVLKGKDLLAMIREIVHKPVEVHWGAVATKNHYQTTPYKYAPRLGRKLVSNLYVDMGQGLMQLVEEIAHERDAPADVTVPARAER